MYLQMTFSNVFSKTEMHSHTVKGNARVFRKKTRNFSSFRINENLNGEFYLDRIIQPRIIHEVENEREVNGNLALDED